MMQIKMNQKKIVELLRRAPNVWKVTVINSNVMNASGILDTIVSIFGIAILIEIKIHPDKLSKLQEKFIQDYIGSSAVLVYYPKENKFKFDCMPWGYNLQTEIRRVETIENFLNEEVAKKVKKVVK